MIFLILLAAVAASGQTRQEIVPMRDGTPLAATVYLPAGDGPFPVILTRTPEPIPSGYQDYVEAGYVYVHQLLRGKMAGEFGAKEKSDGYDTVEWIAQQTWSNGKVGILGSGEAGSAGYDALTSGAPHLAAGAIENGRLAERPAEPPAIPILHYAGWTDANVQGSIEFFVWAQHNRKQKLIVHAGELSPARPSFASLARRWFDYWLRDMDTGVQRLPAVQFFPLGDPAATWQTNSGWPPRSDAAQYYLQPGGGLSRGVPAPPASSSSFDYDPRNPVPTRPAKAQKELRTRADILRFTTLPLTAPVAFTGPVMAELYVSTTAADTDFIIRLVDIQPDGEETLLVSERYRLRDRGRDGRPARARKNQIYALQAELGTHAITIGKGHRISLQITSSDAPHLAPHSNTWGPVKPPAEPPIATNTVHHSRTYASRLTLPLRLPRVQ